MEYEKGITSPFPGYPISGIKRSIERLLSQAYREKYNSLCSLCLPNLILLWELERTGLRKLLVFSYLNKAEKLTF